REAAESRELRDAPRINLAQASTALQATTERLGDNGKLQVIGDRATLTLTNADGDQLRRWLAEARSGARARPVEANLTRGPQGHSGTLVVALPGNTP
ncbi:MAG: type II secretion system protein M, partial [Hylemonella sp.]